MKLQRFNLICLFFILTFLTSCEKNEITNPIIITSVMNSISSYSAISGGVISDKTLPVLKRGVCWSLYQKPTYADNHTTDSLGSGNFTSKLFNLNADSTYYVRAYCVTNKDTLYGNQVSFKTTNTILFNPDITYGIVADIDGNEYKTVRIGTQTWMAENLKVTHYQNGDIIPNETDLSKWGDFQITKGAWCWYKNDPSYKNIYGALYNWYAASDRRNIAPAEWHVPGKEDWLVLEKYVNPFSMNQSNGGYQLCEMTTAHWKNAGDISADTNQTGFTALPAGKVTQPNFGFMDLGASYAYFWTSTGTMDGSSCVYLNSKLEVDNMQPNCRGFSIRCIKD